MSCQVIGLDVKLECMSRLKGRYSSPYAKYHNTGRNFPCKIYLSERDWSPMAVAGLDRVWIR